MLFDVVRIALLYRCGVWRLARRASLADGSSDKTHGWAAPWEVTTWSESVAYVEQTRPAEPESGV